MVKVIIIICLILYIIAIGAHKNETKSEYTDMRARLKLLEIDNHENKRRLTVTEDYVGVLISE